jgi:hypothetical protein
LLGDSYASGKDLLIVLADLLFSTKILMEGKVVFVLYRKNFMYRQPFG